MTPDRSRLARQFLRIPEARRRTLLAAARRAERAVRRAPHTAPVVAALRASRRVAGVTTDVLPLGATDITAEPAVRWFVHHVAPRRRYLVSVAADEPSAEVEVSLRWRSAAGRVIGDVAVLDTPVGAGRWVVDSLGRSAVVEVGLRSAAPTAVSRVGFDDLGELIQPPAYDRPAPTRRTPMRIAVLGDSAVLDVLATECHATAASSTLSGPPAVDLLLVTSGEPTAPGAADTIAAYARHGVTTMFWDRHGSREGNSAIAGMVDVVAVIHADDVDRYRRMLGHERVHVLAAAAQVDLHNPRQPGDGRRTRRPGPAVVYLGEAPRASTETSADVFTLAIPDAAVVPVSPSRRAENDHGSVSAEQFLSLCRLYESVEVVGESAAMAGDLTVVARACAAGSTADRDPALAGHQAYREAHSRHTWTHRLADVAGWCNIALPTRRVPTIGVVLATCRQPDAQRTVDWLAQLDQTDVELRIALLSSFDPAELNLDRLPADRLVAVQQDLTTTLGDHLNRGTTLVNADYYAKIDDDDLYGDRYFTDLLLAAQFSRADVVGKHAHYTYLQTSNSTILRYPDCEHRFTHWLAGGTLVWRSSVVERATFPSWARGSDGGFLRNVMDAGMRIYAADRFNFTLIRRTDTSSHTWTISSSQITDADNAQVIGDGKPEFAFL